MQKASTVMEPGKDISVAYFGYKEVKTTMESAEIRFEEQLGGNGYAKIVGLLCVKGEEYLPYGDLPSG